MYFGYGPGLYSMVSGVSQRVVGRGCWHMLQDGLYFLKAQGLPDTGYVGVLSILGPGPHGTLYTLRVLFTEPTLKSGTVGTSGSLYSHSLMYFKCTLRLLC